MECARKRGMCACPAHVRVKKKRVGGFLFFLLFFFVEISSSKDESQFQCNYNIRCEHHMPPPLPPPHPNTIRPAPLLSHLSLFPRPGGCDGSAFCLPWKGVAVVRLWILPTTTPEGGIRQARTHRFNSPDSHPQTPTHPRMTLRRSASKESARVRTHAAHRGG